MNVTFPPKFQPLFEPHRYKVYHGGRGGAKSWSFARAAVLDAYTNKHRWLCTREFQNSVKESVYQILVDTIAEFGLTPWFRITLSEIECLLTGSVFTFKGLQHQVQELKSFEGADRVWIEEAQNMSKKSLDILIPTIRKPGSELWFSFNPYDETDAVYQKFIIHEPPEDSVVVQVNYYDNPWFPDVLEQERQECLKKNPEDYEWIWEGALRSIDETTIFKNVVIAPFESPAINIPLEQVAWKFGTDFGYANDPSAAVRSFPREGDCFIDRELISKPYNVTDGMKYPPVEIDDYANWLDKIPGFRSHRSYADSSRPETISHIRRAGYDIYPCTKYSGSVEEGIRFLQNFNRIVVHPSCPNVASELRHYRWEVKKTTEEIMKKPRDKDNHLIDALRYAYDEDINHKRRGLNIANSTVHQFLARGY